MTRRCNEGCLHRPLQKTAAAPQPSQQHPFTVKQRAGMPGPCKDSYLRQHRIIPALRLKHRSGGSPRQEPPQAAVALRSASLRLGICVAKMLDNVGLRYPHRASGQKPLALCDRCPCFGSLHPPLAALTFAAQSIICAFGLAAAAPRSPYRHLELCGIASKNNTEGGNPCRSCFPRVLR